MYLILLLEEGMKPVPENITVVQNFGEERLIIGADEKSLHDFLTSDRIVGESILVSGVPEAFQEWLKPFPGVWISNNPMLGDWRVVHVKDVATEETATSEA